MAWYEVQEGEEFAHIRASNTRTAFDRGFRIHCGMGYNLKPGEKMTITVLRLRGGTEKVKLLETIYQDNRKKKEEK